MAAVLSPALDRGDPRITPISPRRFGPGALGGIVGAGGGGGSSPAPVSSSNLPYVIQPLNRIQERSFAHLADIWSPVFPRSPTGRGEPIYYTRRAQGVRCRFRTKSSLDEPMEIAAIESTDLISVDTVKFAEDQQLDSSWIIVNRTLREDGSQSASYGLQWIISGEPKRTYSALGRLAGAVKCYVVKQQKNWPGVG